MYIRLLHLDSTITVSLVTAKTRVGPVKKLTIPRMELNGALLLARLLKMAAEDLEILLPSIYAWSDSTIALGWISNVHSKWKVYVSNRVKEIQEMIPHKQCRYVPMGEECHHSNSFPLSCGGRDLHGCLNHQTLGLHIHLLLQ